MTNRFCRFLCATLILSGGARAHDVITTKLTWTEEISRIVYKRCVNCHREGGAAFSLVTYDDARPWAKAIRDEVLSRRMPPWGAVKGVAEFRNDPSLSQMEIDMLVRWVEGGAPRGDDAWLPAAPVFSHDPVLAPDRRLPRLRIASGTPVYLDRDLFAIAIVPENVPVGLSLELVAYLPDGGVRHLIWLHDYRPESVSKFEFLEPVPLPKGTRIALLSRAAASVFLFTSNSKRGS